MKFQSNNPLTITSMIAFVAASLRELPNKVLIFSAKAGVEPGDADTLAGLLNGPVIPGSAELNVNVLDSAIATQDEDDLFDSPVANVNAVTITKQGTDRWKYVCSAYSPDNLANNLSGNSERTALSGIAELVDGLVAGDGTGLENVTAIVLDQIGNRACIVENPTLASGAAATTCEAAVTEIESASQGFGEEA